MKSISSQKVFLEVWNISYLLHVSIGIKIISYKISNYTKQHIILYISYIIHIHNLAKYFKNKFSKTLRKIYVFCLQTDMVILIK